MRSAELHVFASASRQRILASAIAVSLSFATIGEQAHATSLLPPQARSTPREAATARTERPQQDTNDPAFADPQVVATYALPDGRHAITRDELAMAIVDATGVEGSVDAVQHLVNTTLVEQAAKKAGSIPTERETDGLLATLREQLRQQGQSLAEFPAFKHSLESELRRDLALGLAHQRLVRGALGLGEKDRVEGEMMNLWLAEERQRVPIVTDYAKLPPGVAARVAGTTITTLDVGRLLARRAADSERERMIRQIVVMEALDELAKAKDITVTNEEMRVEVAQRRAEAEADPRYQGLSFEQLLKSQGETMASLAKSPVLRTKVLQRKLLRAAWTDSRLDAHIELNREVMEHRHGARRRLGVIFLRASKTPNELIPRSFKQAVYELDLVKADLQDGADFTVVAKKTTEDPTSKTRGGDTGWHHRDSKRLPQQVLEHVWEFGPAEISKPLITDDGVRLVKMLGCEADPDARTIRERLLVSLEQNQLADTATATNIRIAPPVGTRTSKAPR